MAIPAGGERRKTTRLRVLYGAQIPGDDYSPVIDCQVRSFSMAGARLSPSTRRRLPPRFDLRVAKHDRPFRAEIVWQRDGEVGVRFIRERRLAATVFESIGVETPRESLERLRQRFRFEEA